MVHKPQKVFGVRITTQRGECEKPAWDQDAEEAGWWAGGEDGDRECLLREL